MSLKSLENALVFLYLNDTLTQLPVKLSVKISSRRLKNSRKFSHI